MKITISLLIYLLRGIYCLENSSDLTEYLNERARSVGEKLMRHARNKEKFYTVKLNDVNNMKLIGNYNNGEIFILFNRSYALLDRDLYQISQNNYNLEDTFSVNENITFSKTIQYKNLGFISLATANIFHIFGSTNETGKFFKIQNIVQPNITDATFFIHKEDLYLTISSYKTEDLTFITVYKFVDAYFDETEKFLTSSANKLYTFDNKGSEIIIVSQNYGSTSSLYEFKNGNVKKIQKFDTNKPDQILIYYYKQQQYVIIFDEHNTVIIYSWNGFVLVPEITKIVPLKGKKVIFYDNDIPYLLTSNDATFSIFSLTNSNLLLLYNFTINNNWTDIWACNFVNNTMITLGPTVDGVEMGTVTIAIEISVNDEYSNKEGRLSNCFLTLEKATYLLRSKLTELENGDNTRARESFHNDNRLNKLADLQTKYALLKATNTNSDTSQNLVFNTTAIINIPIKAKNVVAKDLRLEKINDKKWEPEHWLSYSEPQEISGLVKIKKLQVDNLETNTDDPIFNNLLSSNGNRILSGSVTIKNLKSDKLETKFLNNIPVEDFYYKSEPTIIQGEKSFPSLQATFIETNQINGTPGKKMFTEFGPNLKVGNLKVENINGINFDKFKNSVFRLGHNQTITGNLTFKTLEAREMIFDTVAKKSNLFTTSTNQIINSSITISKIFTSDMKTSRVNGIDFKNSVATMDTVIIDGPVSIEDLYVKNNLELKGNISKEFLQLNDTHIVGTNESDFLQRYNGKVKIKGNLILKNLNLGKLANMSIFGEKFHFNLNQYWTKSTEQEIPTHFEAHNGISVPHLFTTFVNDVNVNDYMLNSTQQKKSSKFYFDNVTIKGNVLLNPDEQHSPDLQRIQQDSVKINGTFRIKGHKIYDHILKADVLEVHQLKTDEITEDVIKNITVAFPDSNKIQNIVVRGDLNTKNVSTKTINNVTLKELLTNTVYIDKHQNISKLKFENITVKNLFITSKLNQIEMTDLISKHQKIDNITRIDHIFIDNNVTIHNIQNLVTINDKSFKDLINNNPFKSRNRVVQGDVNFNGPITVKDFYCTMVNDVNLTSLTWRILYKFWDQTITEPYTFSKLISENLVTEKINDYDVKNLIDISNPERQEIITPNGLTIVGPTKIQNLHGLFECDIEESLRNLRNPPTQVWDNVVVTGNVTFWDQETLLKRIFDNVVTRQNKDRNINGKITFVDHISVNNVTAQKNINGVNLDEIIEDAVLNRPDIEQVIKGKKLFSKLQAESIVSLQNTNVSTINSYDISEINDKIIFQNDVPIKGNKVFFGGLQTRTIGTDIILGVEPKTLVSFEDETREIPQAVFESLSVTKNLNVKFVNGMPFHIFMDERLLKKSPKQSITGNYFFQDINFNGNIETPQINDVQMENVVYDYATQVIESPKKFLNDIKIIGHMNADLVNGLQLSNFYEKAVLKDEETNFTRSLFMMKPTIVEGNIQTKYINNIPVDYMTDTSANYSLQTEAQKMQEITEIISSFIRKYFNTTIRMPTEIFYIEKTSHIQINLPNTINAQIAETNDGVLIHIESEEGGQFCGLPQLCKCPVQQTMQISSEHSVNMFINKAMQRIYTFYDEDIAVHLITHSVSTNSYCRTNKTKVINEVSSLAWNTQPRENNTGGFSVHRAFFNGYISGVKFFTISSRTYVVVGIYYDPVLNTHSVNSLVLRINEDKTAVEEIQKIPTVGVKTISIIPTAQGIVLILGSDFSGETTTNETITKIYRFNQERQQFELLREVPAFRALFAEGVVLGMDSLIILVDELSTLHILKYQEEVDNYYFYQSLQMDHPVSSISVFYAKDFGISDAYLSVVTTNDKYFIYSFQFIEGWKLEFSGESDGIKSLVPFKLNRKSYLFAPSAKLSSLLTLVEHDSN